MPRWTKVAALNAALFAALLALLTGAQDWDAAARKITRLSPDAFPKLPSNVREALIQRGCTIPQSFADKQPHNIITGEFARKGQTDIAVLCSRNAASSVLVFWGGKAGCKETELASAPDKNYLQLTGNGTAEYSRAIGKAGAKFIRERYAADGGTKPPGRIDHVGIDDRFLEKGSVVHYCHAGRWLKLMGSD